MIGAPLDMMSKKFRRYFLCIQTKHLIAGIVATTSLLPHPSRSSTRRRALPMSRDAVPNAALPAKPNPEAAAGVVTASRNAKCSKCPAPIAAKLPECRLSPLATDQFTAGTATHRSRGETAGKTKVLDPWDRFDSRDFLVSGRKVVPTAVDVCRHTMGRVGGFED